MTLDRDACDRARRARDARFDGRFFIAVTTTGIYCRPICPARAPKDEHVRYFETAAAAEAAGFRPCLRCRPEASPGSPAWHGTSNVVSRALRMIADGALDERGVDALADRLGVTGRHLRRLFGRHLGATPLDVALTRRLHFAKTLLDETTLPMHVIAFAAGFGSLRRFNSHIRRTFARTPTALRRLARQRMPQRPGCYRFDLAYRPPYDWDAMLGFLEARATPGVEAVVDGHYRRTVRIGEWSGAIDVSHAQTGHSLWLEVRFGDPTALLAIVERVRRMFDLAADPALIHRHLEQDSLLRGVLAQHPGLRVPGAWNGFELAVRAVIGQQISVAAATTIAGRLAAMFGARTPSERGLERLFPAPDALVNAPVERAGLIARRADTVRLLARHVVDGRIAFDAEADVQRTVAALENVPGIGAWTAAYVAMRAFSDPDAFPHGDRVLCRVAGNSTPPALDRRAQTWRPWRSYAVMLLWRAAADEHPSRSGVTHAAAARRAYPYPPDRTPDLAPLPDGR